jgi:hypothetical protein
MPSHLVEPFRRQNVAAHWSKMVGDRYGEHQCPDLPAYTVVTEANTQGAKAYQRNLRPFGEKMLLAAIAARFGFPGWLDAMRHRASDFRTWCRSSECDPWVGDYDLCEIVEHTANFMDMCADDLTTQEKTAFLDGTEAFAAKMRDVLDVMRIDAFPLDSHAFSIACIYAELGCILKAHGRTEAGQKALDYWSRRMMKHWPCFGGKDGGWWMGPAYWKWHLTPIVSAMEALKELGGPDLLATPCFAISCGTASGRTSCTTVEFSSR